MFPSKLVEIDVAGFSETGPVREENQDAILASESPLPGMFTFLLGLADGMGGHACGDIASKLALSTFRQVVIDARGVQVEKMLRRAVEITNMQVYRAAHEMNVGRMGTTLTAAYLFGDQLFLAHLGDSRAYLARGNQIVCLTNDHSLVGDLVRSRVITPDLVRGHEQRAVLTRAIGLELFVAADITNHRLLAGDRLILCSDGIWSVLEDDEILELARENLQANAFGNELILKAFSRGSDDNCSAVVADIRFFQPLATPKSEPVQRKWFGVF